MKIVDKIYNETMNEIESYNPEKVLEDIISQTNKKIVRNIDEFWVEFTEGKNKSVGTKKTKKVVDRVKEGLLIFLLFISLIMMSSCRTEIIDVDPETTLNIYYQEMLEDFYRDLYGQAYNKGLNIGEKLQIELMNEYVNGKTAITEEDIVREIGYIIRGDIWYSNFNLNFSLVGKEPYEDFKYDVANQIYVGIMDNVYGDKSTIDVKELCERLVGNNLVIFDPETNELYSIPCKGELSEMNIVNNIIELSNYYTFVKTESRGRK